MHSRTLVPQLLTVVATSPVLQTRCWYWTSSWPPADPQDHTVDPQLPRGTDRQHNPEEDHPYLNPRWLH